MKKFTAGRMSHQLGKPVNVSTQRGEKMLFNCKCMECEKHIKVLFDFRYVRKNKIELYVIEDDGKYPKPTGYCVECVKDVVGKDLDFIASKSDNEKVSYIDFGRRESDRSLSATGTA